MAGGVLPEIGKPEQLCGHDFRKTARLMGQ